MTSRLALRGSTLLFALGLGLANACGVASAVPTFPQARYEVSGPGVAQFIYFQTDTGRQRTGARPDHLQDPDRRQRGGHRDGDDGEPSENRLHTLTRARLASVTSS